MNNLETPGEDIGEEVKEEGAEHQIFFSFTDDAFSDPAGNGNIDNASDKINYKDTDAVGNPIVENVVENVVDIGGNVDVATIVLVVVLVVVLLVVLVVVDVVVVIVCRSHLGL